MNIPPVRAISGCLAAALIALHGTTVAPEPDARIRLPQGFLARAVLTGSADQVDFAFAQHADANEPGTDGHPPILIAAMQENWPLVRRLLEAGARADVADSTGMTPLMAATIHGNTAAVRLLASSGSNADAVDSTGRTALHYALVQRDSEVAKVLLPLMTRFDFPQPEDRDLLNLALTHGDPVVAQALLERLPPAVDWNPRTRRALKQALKSGNEDQIRLLLTKHRGPPTVEGGNLPLLAQAIVEGDMPLLGTLLSCGADPNTLLPKPVDKKFVADLPSKLMRNYLEEDSGITVLMLAASLGKPEAVRALLDAGADRNRSTTRDKWIALYFAARSKNWQSLQTLLGGGPLPEQLRIEISLASQRAALIKNGTPIFTTQISTGRSGFGTPVGQFVVTDKERDHRSTIYKVPMPYFMRLSCLDFGMHEGVVPRYPASHGCIRLPAEAAKKLFSEIPVGTVVTIN
jgi:ankyrin repeat protein